MSREVKTRWYQQDRHTAIQTRSENLEINCHICGQLAFNKGAFTTQWGRSHQQTVAGRLERLAEKIQAVLLAQVKGQQPLRAKPSVLQNPCKETHRVAQITQADGTERSSDQRRKNLTGLVKATTFCASKDTKKNHKVKDNHRMERSFLSRSCYLVRDLSQNTENLLQLST